ncbi:MAG: hypothetical protein DRP82_03135 [Planctomycetota bacterium]|nr:MAG: hypothetical protein DRP82_03135 [Planctomycetota bacterium]
MMTVEDLIEEIIVNLDKYNLDDCLDDIGANVISFLDARKCLFFIHNQETEDLTLERVVGGGEPSHVVRIRMNEGFVGVAAANRDAVLVEDIHDERWAEMLRVERELGNPIDDVARLMALPLVAFENLVGVLEVGDPSAEQFSEENLERLKPLVNIAAVAIPRRMPDESFAKLAEIAVRFLEEKDQYTHGHSIRVMRYALLLADKINLPLKMKNELRICALLHDIGKVIIRDSILRKKGRLTDSEFETIKMHCRIGANICSKISRSFAKKILSHHERWDGKGYPEGLKGTEIPLISRIIAIADAFDAMTSERPYRPKMPIEAAIEELKKGAASQFDPHLVEAFIELYEDGILNIIKV